MSYNTNINLLSIIDRYCGIAWYFSFDNSAYCFMMHTCLVNVIFHKFSKMITRFYKLNAWWCLKRYLRTKSVHITLTLSLKFTEFTKLFVTCSRIGKIILFPSSLPAVNHRAELTIVQPVKRILDFRIIWQNLAKKKN